jgi:hypothetical protein
MKKLLLIGSLVLFTACQQENPDENFEEFYEGPPLDEEQTDFYDNKELGSNIEGEEASVDAIVEGEDAAIIIEEAEDIEAVTELEVSEPEDSLETNQASNETEESVTTSSNPVEPSDTANFFEPFTLTSENDNLTCSITCEPKN